MEYYYVLLMTNYGMAAQTIKQHPGPDGFNIPEATKFFNAKIGPCIVTQWMTITEKRHNEWQSFMKTTLAQDAQVKFTVHQGGKDAHNTAEATEGIRGPESETEGSDPANSNSGEARSEQRGLKLVIDDLGNGSGEGSDIRKN